MTFPRAILALLAAGLLVACGDTTEQQSSSPPERPRQPPAQAQPPPSRRPPPREQQPPGQLDREAVGRSLEAICARFKQTGGDLVDRVARAVEDRDAVAAAGEVRAALAQLRRLVDDAQDLPSSPEGRELREAVQSSLQEDVEAARRLEQALGDGLRDPRAVAGAFSALSDLARSRDQLAELGLQRCA